MTERNKNILLGVLIVGVLSMTVAFAALSTRLNIGGQASVASTNWNVHFDNWRDVTENTITNEFGTQQNTAVHPAVDDLTMSDNTNVTKVEGLNIILKQPNDYAKYTFEIVNEGSIDAELSGFSANMTCTSNNNCSDVVDYEVKCYGRYDYTGTEVTTQSVISKDRGRAYCYLQVKYKDQSSAKSVVNKVAAADKLAYTQEAISFQLAPEWTWVQNTVAPNNNQGGGNVTPTGNYTYYIADPNSDGSGSDASLITTNTYDSSWKIYIRQDTNGNYETCGTYPSGTACVTSSYYNSDYSSVGNYNSDFSTCSSGGTGSFTSSKINNSCLKGYAKTKAEEMLSKGAPFCDVNFSYVYCYMPSGGGCDVYDHGRVHCGDGSYYFRVNSDGSIN